MWSIKILKGSRVGEKFDLKQGDNLIGRSPSCDIAIQSTGISKEHARITVNNNEVTIYDLQSTNGTFVNGVRVHKQKLKLTDKISIFDILLGFESKTASPEIPGYHQIPAAFHGSAAAQYSPLPSHSEIPTASHLEKKDFLVQAENYLEDVLLPGVYKIPENLEMKWSVGLLVFIFVLIVTILSVFPMIELTKNGIQRESQRRALSLSKNLAERYQISVKDGMESSFSTSTFEREGVESAYIISSGDGTIIAPVKKIGIRPDDAFVHTARKQDQAQVNQISDNLVGATFPIKTFDTDAGSVKVIAHSVIIYDMGSLAIDTGRTISLFAQVLGIAAAFGFLLYYFIFKIMEYPLKSLSKQLDDYLKNGHTTAESSFQFLALQDLVNHINTLMSRASNPTSSSHSLALVDPQTEAQNLIQNYPAGSLAIDKNGYILAVNEQFLDIAGLSSQNIQGYKIDQLSDQALILSIKDLIEQSQNSNGLTVFNSLEFSGRNIRLGLQPLYDKTDIKYFLLTMQTNEGGWLLNTLATQLHPTKYFIEVIQGPEKGATYELFSSDIRIGRDETNDIILIDSKCSRDHAIITIQNSIYYIEDLKSQNGTLVDGQKITKVLLKSGSEIQIGGTVLKFKVIHDIPKTLPNTHSFLKNNSSNSLSGSSNKKIKFYGIIGAIVILFLFLLNTPSMNSPQTSGSTTDDEILASQKRQESILKNQNLENLNSRQYLDAQAAYMKGLRDYREGFYKSAFVSFNAAIAIYPEHKLARRYLRLSQNKLDEQVQVLMNEGNIAMEENKYQLAQSAFKNVLVLINDPENKLYKEAKEKLNECNLMLRESF